MTADVNVTEKVARAVYAAIDHDLPADPTCAELKAATDRAATAALTALSDPEVLAGMAEVLYEADPLPGKPSWGGLRSESAKWPDGMARWAETRALERATALADWLRGQG